LLVYFPLDDSLVPSYYTVSPIINRTGINFFQVILFPCGSCLEKLDDQNRFVVQVPPFFSMFASETKVQRITVPPASCLLPFASCLLLLRASLSASHEDMKTRLVLKPTYS